jgi:hypothetical protein
MSSTNTIERVPFSEIATRPDYQSLTVAQQMWIRVYLLSGERLGTYDALSATKLAYPDTSAKNLASRACHVQSHKKVRHILNIAFGEPEPQPLLEDLRHAIRKSVRRDGGLSADTTAAIKFYERQSGKKMAVTRGK